MEEQNSVFRKKTLERISSPEQLTDYLHVTGPGIWIMLIIIMLLLGSIFTWAAIGTLETKADVSVDVKQHNAVVIAPGGEKLAEGMPLRVSGQDTTIASATADEYGRTVGVAEVALPDGKYEGEVVTETVHAIDFLIESR